MVICSSWRWTKLAGKMDRRLIRPTLFVLHWIRGFLHARWDKETLFLVHRDHPVSNPLTFSCACNCRVWAYCACVQLRWTRLFNAAVRPFHSELLRTLRADISYRLCSSRAMRGVHVESCLIKTSFSERSFHCLTQKPPPNMMCGQYPASHSAGYHFSSLPWFSSWFPSVSLGKCRRGPSKTPRPLASAFLPIHYPTINPQFSITQSELLTEMFNKS